MKHFSLLLLFTLLSTSLSAQLLEGKRAANIVPEAAALRFADQESLPQYIRLVPSAERAMTDAPAYLKTYLRLPAGHEFSLINAQTDRYEMEHQRFRQTVDGYPVIGGTYIFHGRNGNWTEANGELYLPETQTATILVTPTQAIAAALDALPAETYGWESDHPVVVYPSARLVWVPVDLNFQSGNFRLAYETAIYRLQPAGHEKLYLDAATGEIIAREQQLHTAAPVLTDSTDVPGLARTRYSGDRMIVTTCTEEGDFILSESGRGNGIVTYNAERQTTFPYTHFRDDDNFWNNVNADRDEVATDCHWGSEMFYDLLQTLGRNSIDGEGERLEAHVHYDQNWPNASWDGIRSRFGDGSSGAGIELPSVTLDVVAHEFTHGLTDRTSDLIYANESGGLNESFSDIFGVATVFAFRPENASWKIGPDLSLDGEGIRNMRNPHLFNNPKTYRGDFWVDGGSVHSNSGVQNHWFYLLTEGGTGTNELETSYSLEGLGLETALEIAYRNNTFYLTESSNYHDAGFNAVLAAASAYGSCSEILDQVAEAWKAVGVDVDVPNSAIANFRVDGPFCELGAEVSFINNSFGNAYFWDFGDGNTSTEQSPVHTYDSAGSYTVSLTVDGCSAGDTDQLVVSDAVIVDPDNVYCTPDVMTANDTTTISSCRGVIFDSGGPNARYQSDENSILTIVNPLGDPITLEFVSFVTENLQDRLTIYDGPDADAPELRVLSGFQLPDPVTSSGSSITLAFRSNSNSRFNGWEILYGGNQSNSAPDAAFVVDDPSPLLNQVVRFEPDVALPGPLTYFFADGSAPLEAADGTVTHQFTEPGTYEVMAVDFNCMATDTFTQTVTVAEGINVTVSPVSITDTLFTGETAVHNITVTNPGNVAGFLRLDLRDFDPVVAESMIPFSLGTSETDHLFTDLAPTLLNFQLEVVVAGDFENANEFATITVEGVDFGTVGGSEDPADWRRVIVPTPAQLADWRADGQIEVSIVNEGSVSPIGVTSFHQVKVIHDDPAYLSIPAQGQETELAAGSTFQFPLLLDATDLFAGLYVDTVFVTSNDSLVGRRPVVVNLLVEAVALPVLSADALDFGFPALGEVVSRELTVRNEGSEVLTVNGLNFGNPNFSAPSFTPAVVFPGDELTLEVTFVEATTLGVQQSTLNILTSVGDLPVDLTATVSTPPEADFSEAAIVVTVPFGGSKDTFLTISNLATTPLFYELEQAEYRENSEQFYTDEVDTTAHLFTDIQKGAGDYRLRIIVQGDYSSPVERYSLFLDGQSLGFQQDNNLPDNTPDTLDIPVPASLLADRTLEVVIENSGTVTFSNDFANRHDVTLYQVGVADWLTLPGVFPPIGQFGQEDSPLIFDAEGLLGGSYFTSLRFNGSDPEKDGTVIPVELIVVGMPVAEFSQDSLNFGGVPVTTVANAGIEITNSGTDSLIYDQLLLDNGEFLLTANSFRLAPGASGILSVQYDASLIGDQTATLTLSGPNTPTVTIPVTGTGLGIAVAEFSRDTLRVELVVETPPAASVRLPMTNSGQELLRYHFGTSGTKVVTWNYALDNDAYFLEVANVLEELDSYTFELLDDPTPVAMVQALSQADVLLIPNMIDPDAAVLTAMQAAIRGFLDRGGNVILLGGASGNVPIALGLLGGSAVRLNPGGIPVTLEEPDHPLFVGVTTPFSSSAGMTYHVGSPGLGTTVLARMFNQPSILSREIGRGLFVQLAFTYNESNEASRQILRNAFDYVRTAANLPEWLEIAPLNNELSTGESTAHEFTFIPGDLEPGIYNYNLPVYTNEPGADFVDYYVPVKMSLALFSNVYEAAAVNELTVFPNPTNGPLSVRLDLENRQAVSWQLLNVAGQAVRNGQAATAAQHQLQLDLSALPASTYYLQIRNAEGDLLVSQPIIRN